MFKLNSKLTMACSAAVLALAMAACSSSSDDNPPVASSTPPPVGDGGPDPVLTELEMAQADAAAAATAAMTASGEAETAAAAAMAAVANLATMQTGATAAGLADEAHAAAGKAMTAYMDAKAASEAAAAAEVVTAAVEARIMAETAMANAVKYAETASEKGTAAETAAMAELMIVDTVKTVGGTDLDATAGSSEVITDGNTVRTGLMAKTAQPMTTVIASPGVPGVPAEEDDPSVFKATTAGAAARTFPIGKLVDSADDMARLMIVTQYAGSKTAKVYAQVSGAETQMTTKAGFLSLEDNVPDNDDVNNVALKSEGNYYLAGTGATPAAGDSVGATAKAVEVFSYVDPNESQNADGDKTYVVWTSALDTGASTATTYTEVTIHVTLEADGDTDTTDVHEVTAKIPEATDYKHIHFGVWAALGDPEKDGSQKLSDLGIGFVQNFSGEGLTPIGGGSDDMPNNGTARTMVTGFAAVQRADEDGNGAINLRNGDATVMANFEKDTVSAALTDLATLSGKISGNEFSGEKASDVSAMHGLDDDGTFMGSFSGGFYGAKAAEAGGVFDFTSEDAEAGAFRGAFGGDRK